MKKIKTIFSFTMVIAIVVLSFLSCSKDSNDDSNPFETTVTTSDFSISMDENPSDGFIIGTVSGTTNQGSVTFSIIEQSPANAFTIDAASGELKVLNKVLFDFETNPTIT
ncbi:cadherin repeat domain-containing protein, partial [Aequorivita sp. SDUM287046]